MAATQTHLRPTTPRTRTKRRPQAWPLRFYSTAVGKKWVMAITGIVGLGFVLVHMIGNLKLFISREEVNLYGEALRDLGGHLVPQTSLLWILRMVLLGAIVLHVHAAVTLTAMNRRARPTAYQSPRSYVAASFASRTMRWTGIIVFLYLLFHLADLTWGFANPDFVRGDPYNNVIASMERLPVALIYVIANVALCIHIAHGTWSLFQSLGWNNPRYNGARVWLARGLAAVILVGNLTFPVAVQLGLVEQACPGSDPTAECDDGSGLAGSD